MSEPAPILPFERPAAARPPSITLAALVAQYLSCRAAEHRAGAIQDEHLRRMRDHLNDLAAGERGDLPATDLRPSVAKQWLCAHQEWRSPHTLENAYRSLRGLMRWAEEEELVERNPVRGFKRFWPPPQPRGACRPEEYEAIMRAARGCRKKVRGPGRQRARRHPSATRFRFQLWFLWQTGCRTCELRAALWEHVDWQRGLLILPRPKTHRATGRARSIPLPPHVLRVLRWLYRRRVPGIAHIFTAAAGRPLKRASWDRLFRKYARLAGVRESMTLYTLRHGFCVEGLVSGVGDQDLAEIMGHTSTKYIRWYGRDLRERTEHLRAAAARVHQRRRQEDEGRRE